MFLTRWDPFFELSRMQSDLAKVAGTRKQAWSWSPTVDIYEDKDAVHLKADLPGVKAEDVHISVENAVLTLSGERKLEHKEAQENDGYRRIESSYGAFTRSFSLPNTVNPDAVSAHLDEGILTIRIPKRTESLARKINVSTSSGGSGSVGTGSAPSVTQ